MLWRKLLCLNLCAMSVFATSASTAASENGIPTFASGEHLVMGDNLKLFTSKDDPGSTHQGLLLPNKLKLSYGEVMAMADFYGTPGQPISSGKTEAERNALFMLAFNAFAKNENFKDETKQLLDVIHADQKQVDDGMKHGQMPEEIYRRLNSESNRKYNCITGGGCSSTWWLVPGRYLDLATTDDDHFGMNAVIVYQVGHKLALEQAAYAYKTGDLKQLEIAYAYNAFAGHFLADTFSSGHMRVPRTQLRKMVSPEVVGSLLATYMHAEENEVGLHVHNKRGEKWFAYGDAMYFNPKNSKSRQLVEEALQESVNEIFATFMNGVIPSVDKAADLIPQVDFVRNMIGSDVAPLFYLDEKTNVIYRRVYTSNKHDYHWTPDWWGWTTLIQILNERGLPTVSQAEIARSGHGKEALKFGLITDKNVMLYINNQH